MKRSEAKRRSRGYTVVEVMSAMTLFAIGAAGVLSMQRVTIQGADDARRMDVATNIANEWASRLQRDAAFWTEPNAVVSTSNHTTHTKYIRNALTSATGSTAWLNPAPAATDYEGRSWAFDLFGRDLATPGSEHIFCAQHRLTWITYPSGGASAARPLLKAEIRVFWKRIDLGNIKDCATVTGGPDPASAAERDKYHFVHVTTAVRPSASQ